MVTINIKSGDQLWGKTGKVEMTRCPDECNIDKKGRQKGKEKRGS